MIIYRDYERTEHDDFILNVEPLLNKFNESIPIYNNGEIICWKIQNRYE